VGKTNRGPNRGCGWRCCGIHFHHTSHDSSLAPTLFVLIVVILQVVQKQCLLLFFPDSPFSRPRCIWAALTHFGWVLLCRLWTYNWHVVQNPSFHYMSKMCITWVGSKVCLGTAMNQAEDTDKGKKRSKQYFCTTFAITTMYTYNVGANFGHMSNVPIFVSWWWVNQSGSLYYFFYFFILFYF
jgi:hypothetical protein